MKTVFRSIAIPLLSLFFLLAGACTEHQQPNFLTQEETQWLDDHRGKITIAPDAAFAPFEFFDAERRFEGIAADYVALVEKMLHFRFNIVCIKDWQVNVQKAKAREFDVWSAVVATPERSEYMLFTRPYIDIAPIFVVPASRMAAFSLNRNTGERIAVVREYFLHEYIRQNYPDVPLVTVRDTLEGLKAILNGTADVMLTDAGSASFLIKKENLPGLKVSGEPSITGQRLAFAVRKDWPILHSILSKTLNRIPEAKKDEIMRKWIGLERSTPPVKVQRKLTLTILLSAVTILILLALFIPRRNKASPAKRENAVEEENGRGSARNSRLRVVILTAALIASLTLLLWAGVELMKDGKKKEFLSPAEKKWLQSHADQLTIAPDSNFAPVEFIEQDGIFQGIAADYVKLLEDRLGCTFTILKIKDWSENVRRAKNRQLSIWSAVAPTDQKKQYMLFTQPYLDILTAFIVPQGSEGEFALENLNDKSIVVVDGYFGHDYLKKNYPKTRLFVVKDAATGLLAVSFKEADAMLIDLATASYLIEKEGLTNLKVANTIDLGYGLAFASRSDLPILNVILEKGLAQISNSERQAIYNKWVHVDRKTIINHRALLVSLFAGGIILTTSLLGILLWNVSLRRMVWLKTRYLAEREALLQSIFRSVPDGIGLVTNRKFEWSNKKLLEMTGYETKELQNASTRILYLDEEAYLEAGRNLYEKVDHHGTGRFETKWKRKDGRIIDVLLHSSPVDSADPSVGYTTTVLDITDRKNVERELIRNEKKYRTIFDAPSDGIIILEARSARIIELNNAALAMHGYSDPEEFKRLSLEDLSSNSPPYTLKHALEFLQKTVNEGPQLFLWHNRRRDGQLFWSEVTLKLARMQDSACVIAVLRDINDRKQAEDALAAEKERLAVTLESIGDAVITTDIEGRVVLINQVAENLTGWQQDEAFGKPLEEIFHLMGEKTDQQVENPVNRILLSNDIVGVGNHAFLASRQGKKIIIAKSSAPLLDENGKTIGVVVVFRDVTERLKMEEELFKVKKLESVGVLAGGIAHDFNNLLAAILGNIDLARQFLSPGDKTFHLLENAEKASLRAKNLTQQLLTFAKGGEPVTETAAIKEVIVDSADFILHGSTVSCKYDIPEDLWLVDIDRGQMSQVIQNLILNSKHAMPDGGTVSIVCRNHENNRGNREERILGGKKYIQITIADHGVGIPKNIRDRIFDPYFSTKKDGSGLGLAVAHSIVSKHQGHISVSSEEGNGTTFSLFLQASKKKKQPSMEIPGKAPSQGKGRILVMDDEELVRDIVESMLRHMGFEVITASSGEKAYELYKELHQPDSPIDAVIMDLTVPGGLGGEETVQLLHQTDPTAKVLVASGYSNDPVMANFREYGFCGALTKPFQFKDLSLALHRVLSDEEGQGKEWQSL